VIETTYQAETGGAFVAPEVQGLGLTAPAFVAPVKGRQIAGLGWRQTGEVCPQIAAVRGAVPSTSVPGSTTGMADLRPMNAFATKHEIPGLHAWSPPS
jgi:hypothetical protein